MSINLALVDSIDLPEVTPEPIPQGRLARFVSMAKALKGKIGGMPLFTQLKGVSSASWLVGFVGSIVILNRFVSPIITELAMTTLIAPIAALVLVAIGEFDFTKLTTMVTANVGIIFATGGFVIWALFVQNVVKMSLLTQSWTSQSHKQYRTYALASMLTPVTTSALWYMATKLGYFLGAKTISVAMVAMFASSTVGQALKKVDPLNTTTAELATAANALSDGLRWGLAAVLLLHLFFVFKSYGLVHKGLNWAFDLVAQSLTNEDKKPKMFVEKMNSDSGKMESKMTGFGCLTLIVVVVSAVGGCWYVLAPSAEERKAAQVEQAKQDKIQDARAAAYQKRQAEEAWRVACVDGTTYVTEEGKAYRLTNKNGTSHCVDPGASKMLALGKPFSVGSSYRHEIVLKEAAGYDSDCLENHDAQRKDHTIADHNCRKDLTIGRDVRYWLELPDGLPKGVKMPPVALPGK